MKNVIGWGVMLAEGLVYMVCIFLFLVYILPDFPCAHSTTYGVLALKMLDIMIALLSLLVAMVLHMVIRLWVWKLSFILWKKDFIKAKALSVIASTIEYSSPLFRDDRE